VSSIKSSPSSSTSKNISNYAQTPYFISSNIGYVCLQTSYNYVKTVFNLLKTTDGGEKWVLIENSYQLTSVAFVNSKIGYGIQNSTLVNTTDGGITWRSVDFFKNKKVNAIDIVNQNVLFIILPYDSKQEVYRTENSGVKWVQINLPTTSFYIGDMSWLSANAGYAYCGGDSACGSQEKAIYYTNDSGIKWSIRSQAFGTQKGIGTLSFGGDCTGIKFFSNGVGYIGGGTSSVMKSTDGGVDFSEMFKNGDEQYDSGTGVPDFINCNEGFSFFASNGTSNYLEHTTNGGNKWIHIISVDNIATFAK
jgi:hypothetical protein